MTQPIRIATPLPCRRLAANAAAVSCIALLAACSGDVVNLGEGGGRRQTPPSYSDCVSSPTLQVQGTPVAGTLIVDSQERLDALEGCETIAGSLLIRPRFQPDLRPLHALKVVEGSLSLQNLSYEADFQPEEWEASLALLDEGWVHSLAGLEALERVGSLVLEGVAATDFSPLSQLRLLTAGELVLRGTQLTDLAALAGLGAVRGLEISGPVLESIADLQLSPSLTFLDLQGERLSNASSLQNVTDVQGDVSVVDTELADLSALSRLQSVGGALTLMSNQTLTNLDGLEALDGVLGATIIEGNPALESMDALRRLQVTSSLELIGNDALARMPELLFMSGLTSINILGNASLQRVSEFPGLVTNSPIRANPFIRAISTPEGLLQARQRLIQVAENPLLEHLALPAGFQSIQQTVVRDNALLRDLDIGTLEAIDLLAIANNPQLASIDLGDLVSVDLLSVVDNPLLPAASFDAVKTFERQMSGNAGQ